MSGSLILAVDIGTSSVRCMALDREGVVRGKSQRRYPVVSPHPDFEEQDPRSVSRELIAAVKECVSACGKDADRIGGISFSSQMYSLLLLDKKGEPLTNSILWSDGRSVRNAERLREEYGKTGLYRTTGCPASAIYPISKILWMAEERSDLFNEARWFVSIKEYIMNLFVDKMIIDYSVASATGLFDIYNHKWAEKALEAVGVRDEHLAEAVPGSEGIPVTNTALLKELGLNRSLLLYPGGGDGPLANLGAEAGNIGDVNIDLGTSGAVRVMTDRVLLDDSAALWCYCLTKDLWTSGGILTNVGNALVWLIEKLLTQNPLLQNTPDIMLSCNSLESLAAHISDGAENLYFLPYMRRARSPYWDPRLSGNIFGLKAHHDSRHIVRALFESIAYDLRSILSVIEERGMAPNKVVLSGGFCRGIHIPRIISDVLDHPVIVRDSTEASLLGAALIGLNGMGEIPGLTFVGERRGRTTTITPHPRIAKNYARHYATYRKLVEIDANQIYSLMEADH